MQLIEVLLVELASAKDPGPRSTQPDGLEVVVRLHGERAGEQYSGGATVTFPPRLQSPWNAPGLVHAMEHAVRSLVGSRVAVDSAGPASASVELVRTWEERVLPYAVARWQRTALGLVGDALRVAAGELVRRIPDAERSAADLEPVEGYGTVSVAVADLSVVAARMGRAIWERVEPMPAPWDVSVKHNTYDAGGMETLGKNALDSYLLEREAHRLGLSTVRVNGVDFHAEDHAGRSIGFHCTTGPSTSRYVSKVCGNKQLTRTLLARAGVAVAPGQLFVASNWRGVAAFARLVGWPVVLKPPDGKGGKDVTSNIQTEEELERVLNGLVERGHRRVILEKHVAGADYRFFVVGSSVVSVVQRTAGGVVGDGQSTVAELVLAKNLVRLRNPHLRTRLLLLGKEATDLLRSRDLTADWVPEKGEHVLLTTAGNISRGGESIEVLDETHPSLLAEAVRAVQAIPGLHHAGVDLLVEDHRRSLEDQTAVICELNSLPATTSHHYPAVGPPRNVSRALMEHYVKVHGLGSQPQPDTISTRVRVRGSLHVPGYQRWFAGLAGQLELSGVLRGHPDASVEAELTGPLGLVSVMSVRAFFSPGPSRPDLVETTVIDARHTGEFRIKS